MASFADQDFGSESEDDNFNPVQEIGSDDEAAVPDASPDVSGPQSEQADPLPDSSRRNDEVKDEDEDKEGKQQTEDLQRGRDPSEDQDADDDNKETVDGVNDEGPIQDGEDDGDDGEQRDDEEDEDEDEEDEDEEEIRGRPRKRHKRDRRLQFIDVEAEVDEDEEDEVDDDEELGGENFIAETHPDDLAELPAGAERDDRRHRELDRRRELEENMDAEKQAAALRERYGRNRVTHAEDSVMVPQRLLLPSVEDPTIWGVRTKPGKEREVVFSIMKRFEDRLQTREPLAITSALERGGTMAGYVYVEARRQADVLAATEGISFCYPRTKMILVPINEMPDLLRTTKSKSLEPGMYVRIKRGKYQGDLAQIDEVESNDLDVIVRIVPRLDYGLNEDANAPITDASAAKRKRPGFGSSTANRPPQRLFSEVEAKKKHLKYLQQVSALDKKNWQYLGDRYESGFLVKDMKIQHLQTEDVRPTLEEVTRFTSGAADGTENLDLSALAATLKASNTGSSYLPGDMVEIYEGEQQGVSGRATSVTGDIVTLTVIEGPLRGQTIEAPVKGLRKRFRPGDHVKVIGGSKYHDEVGMVVRIKDDRVSILSDSTNQEITVFSKDLREATDSSGASGASKFDLLDLVQLDPATVACVVKVDREALRVLDQNGSVRSILPSSISNKLERRRHAVSTDRDGNEIRNDDTVKEVIGEQKQGRVVHIHRNFLFIQNRQQTENAGMFVARNNNVQTVAAKGGRTMTGPDLTKMNPGRQANGAANGSAMPPPRQLGRDRLIGKTVMCKKGQYKGLMGIVKDTTDADARVEFHAKNKVLTIPKESLVVKDPVTGQTIDMKFGAGRGRVPFGQSGIGGATPGWAGSRTPMVPNGGKTPAWGAAGSRTPAPAWQGGKTPAWSGGGSKTPAWGADGSRTVNPYADGSRTAYGGATTSWNPNTRTPYHSSSGFESGSKTPAYNAFDSSRTPAYTGSKTPAYGAGSTAWSSNSAIHNPPSSYGGGAWSRPFDAPTPGFNSAPTPGGDVNHPTPGHGGFAGGQGGGGYGPRRGRYGSPAASAPTPGGYPETPGAFGVDTPGVGADDDPRYE